MLTCKTPLTSPLPPPSGMNAKERMNQKAGIQLFCPFPLRRTIIGESCSSVVSKYDKLSDF